jgi:hypothetical protein
VRKSEARVETSQHKSASVSTDLSGYDKIGLLKQATNAKESLVDLLLMATLTLPPRYTPDSIALFGAAVEAGWYVERLQSWRAPHHLQDESDIALYGEPLFGATVAEQLALILLEPTFGWLAEIPREYRLRNVMFTTLADARNYRGQAFIKPADDKCFPAKVYADGSLIPASDLQPSQTPVLISEPVNWGTEFRCFVLDGEIATCSPYSRNGKLIQADDGSWPATSSEIENALAFCRGLISNVRNSLPPSVVVDVGEIIGRGWAVVEANPSWASGIYGCDPSEVLRVIARACIKRDRISLEDRKWILER